MSRRVILALVLSLLALVFALQNTSEIEVHFLTWNLTTKVAYAVGIPFLLGVFVGGLVAWREQRKAHKLQQQPEPGSPAALLATADVAKKKKKSWWW
ncbi:MAG: lipopolysaccharide assembly protein LapA domain-containing protein [Candidatus Binatia bacterium]